MIEDCTGIELIPGNGGADCPGNDKTRDAAGHLLPCCCDECDYLVCCLDPKWQDKCRDCHEVMCPHFLQ